MVRVVYIVSLVVLGILTCFLFIHPFTKGNKYDTVQKEQLLKTKDGWIIQFDLINSTEKDIRYSIKIGGNNVQPYEESVIVRSRGVFTYIHHIQKSTFADKKLNISIFREGAKKPFETATYYLE